MTEYSKEGLKKREAGTLVLASCVINKSIPHKESFMSKLGYFFAGVVAGATALTAAAFMVDDFADKLDASSDSDEDLEATESDDSTGNTEATGKTANLTM